MCEAILLHHTAADEMLLDDAFQDIRRTPAIPCALGIHDRDGAFGANAEAIRFRARDATVLGETEFAEAMFEVRPRRESCLLGAAFRLRLIRTEKNMSAHFGNTDGLGDDCWRSNGAGHECSAGDLG